MIFPQSSSMVLLVKNWHYLLLFILSRIARENVFHDILGKKIAFLDH